MSKNKCFWDFALDVRTLNIVLHGTASHLSEAALCNLLETSMDSSLQMECTCEELSKIVTLKEWIEQVRKIDEHLRIERKRYCKIFAEESNLRASKHPTLGTSCTPNISINNTTTSSSSSTQKPFICLPKLTDAEKDLLCAHARCFECQRFNAGHSSSSPTCTRFSSGTGYKTITRNPDAAGQLATKPITNSKGKVVTSTIKDVDSDEDEVIATFTPSAALGDGTDSGDSDTVSEITPLKCKHFIWKWTIDGPLSEFPLKVMSLVDKVVTWY